MFASKEINEFRVMDISLSALKIYDNEIARVYSGVRCDNQKGDLMAINSVVSFS
jgi:hypothetical protein